MNSEVSQSFQPEFPTSESAYSMKIWPAGKSKKKKKRSLTFKLYWNLPSVSTKMRSAYWKLRFYCTASSTGEAMALFMCQMKMGVNNRMENAVTTWITPPTQTARLYIQQSSLTTTARQPSLAHWSWVSNMFVHKTLYTQEEWIQKETLKKMAQWRSWHLFVVVVVIWAT